MLFPEKGLCILSTWNNLCPLHSPKSGEVARPLDREEEAGLSGSKSSAKRHSSGSQYHLLTRGLANVSEKGQIVTISGSLGHMVLP